MSKKMTFEQFAENKEEIKKSFQKCPKCNVGYISFDNRTKNGVLLITGTCDNCGQKFTQTLKGNSGYGDD